MADIRLVVWDLDDTFWDGTLAEGGMVYDQARHDIVVALCRRGIMNSICSKNDFAQVRDILIERGLWDYFIFPSIDWTDKGARVAAIAATANMRAETVLFIDDNPTNRAQVAAALPGIRIADETVVAGLLADPALSGKDDAALSRLQQYKLLETRRDAAATTDDTNAFLRGSGVTVEIVYDIAGNIDRAVELINRTNQLNFTKERLPDDPEAAAAALLAQIAPWYVKAGLVRVRDRYGDYGLCGIFVVNGILAWGKPQLRHFAFSCRTLGLGVEQWVYALLDRPTLTIAGTVRSDLAMPVDWINVDRASADGLADDTALGTVRIRGGCELEVLEHFFRASADEVTSEFIRPTSSVLNLPANHSGLLARSLAPLRRSHAALLAQLGVDASICRTRLFDECEDGTLIVYSPTADANHVRHRHRKTGFELPIWYRDVAQPTFAGRTEADAEAYRRVADRLAADYDALSINDVSGFDAYYRTIIAKLPPQALLVVVLPNRWHKYKGRFVKNPNQHKLNEAFCAAAEGCANVRIVEMETLVQSVEEVADSYLHFDRAVYHRLYQAILAAHRDWCAGRPMAPPPAPPVRRTMVGALYRNLVGLARGTPAVSMR